MAERLSILNDPPSILEGPRLLHKLIQWEKHSQNTAIDFASNRTRKRYSYHDTQSCVAFLGKRINEALRKSQTSEPSRQHVVPLLLPQSPGLYISQLAILQSGGAFCPINLDAPRDRIKFVASDVSASIIITTPEFENIVTWENGPTVILVDEFPVVVQEQTNEGGTTRDVAPDDVSYVMYTSGSSGTPKGVAVSHMAVSQSLLAHERHIPGFQRFLQFAAPSFDVSVFEIFFPLLRGSTLVGCDRSQLLNDLPGMITELEVDAAELTPTVVGSLLQKRSNAPGLKLLLTIGEMLTSPIVKEFGGSKTQANMLYGMYGPTEAAIHCTVYPKMEADAKPGNIGIPFDTVSTFIAAASMSLDDAADLKFLPIGDLGELVLSGPQLAQGYLNRDEQNKAAFVRYNGKIYYRTGDKARQLENGTIEILGRISAGQVKLRGQRVELGEIEEVAYKHPGLKTVVVVVLNGILIMFALTDDQSIMPEHVMETCSKWLPKFMVPSEIVLLQQFPYLPSGKVDKRRLESDYQTNRAAENTLTMATETERVVKNVLQEVLGDFSVTTRLAAAGLDSLIAIRVASKLRSSNFNISTVAVLQAETFKSLVSLCDNSISTAQVPETQKKPAQQNIEVVLNGHAKDVGFTKECTPLQSAMLSETALNQEAYRNWIELELPGITDLDDVISVLHDLADSNPILRTGFAEPHDHNGFVQLIWRGLEDSQIEIVGTFRYEFDESKDVSLHRPIRFQILQVQSATRILIHIHHALYDGWSLELLLDDLNSLLSNAPLPSRPPFTDVVESYQKGEMSSDKWLTKDYWRDHLALLDVAQVPNFQPKESPPPSLAIERLQTSLSTTDVEAASRRLSASPQSLFQAAYAIVLSSYLGASDICFGTVFSGRTLPIGGIEDIVGPCLATLPVRVDLSTTGSLQSLVQDLNSTNRKHMEHSTLPLRDIKSISGINPRQLLFDTLLIWQQTLHSYDHKREHVVLVDTVDNLEFNLTLEVIPSLGNIELKANFQQSLFPVSQIRTMLLQVEQLTRAVIEDSNTSLETVFGYLNKSVLSIANEKPDTELKGGTLSSSVENLAITDPNKSAIEFATSIEDEEIAVDSISYSELNSYSNQIGNYLLEEHGVLPDELVCICMEKSIDLYASILATAKIGAGYLPLTSDIPHDRLEHILREAKIRVVMAQSSSRPLLKLFKSVKVFYIDEVSVSSFSLSNIPSRSSPDMVSYCVFTSGSTGTPKGVLVTQGNLLSNLDVLQELYPTTRNSRFLQSCSQAFDVSVFEIFFAWRVGGTICAAVKDVLFRDIENAIRLFKVTHLSLTPTVAALIDPKKVPKVEFLVTAGEGVTSKVFNAWADQGLWQGYGPSETTNICTVKPRVSKSDAINNIGPPFKNTSAFVLAPGPGFTLVPRGAIGEFCFGGSQVFRGYMDRSEEAGKIIDHPDYGRLYRSGDFGRLMPDGSLVFTGRKDDQVKIRGQRVELGEINNIMLRSEQVADCVTMVVTKEEDSSQRLVCFWTSGRDVSEDLTFLKPDPKVVAKLYKSLDSALPAYMIPSALVPISFMPSTTQGKIDKRLLIKHFQSLDVSYLDQTFQASRSTSDHDWTEIEKVISQCVSEVARVPVSEIGPDTSFFNLGIDSISAIQLSKALAKQTPRRVNISDILKYPSVVRLAEKIGSQSDRINASEGSATGKWDFGFDQQFIELTMRNFRGAGKTVQSILPCTPLQEAILSAAEASAEKLYDNSVTFDVRGDITKLERCWQEMVRRHEILRTCFVSTDMKRYSFIQVILENYDLKFALVSSIKDKMLQKEFKPPYSLKLVKSSKSTQLLITMHHALYDGVALAVLYEEVERLYHGDDIPTAVPFAPFLRSMASLDMDEADQFWNSKLRDCGFPKLNDIESIPKPLKNEIHSRIQRISGKCSLSWVEESIRKHSTSLLAACHTAWAAVLAEQLHETDVCFGNIVSGRTIPIDGIERLVAPCFNTIPSRLQNIHQLSYLEAFRKFQTFNADSLPFQLTPLRRIQSKLSPGGSRLFDTLFILQQPPRDLDSSIWTITDDNGAMDFPLVCEVVPKHSGDTLEIMLYSYTSFFSAEDAHTILEAFDANLRAALENPRSQILSTNVKDEIVAKVDSQKQSKSEDSKLEASSQPFSPEELNLRDVLSRFTDVPPENITRDMSIFRLGLDSISTVQVATSLRKLGHKVLASDILENPTIAQLNTFLSGSKDDVGETAEYDFDAFDKQYREVVCSKIGLAPAKVEAVLPCTPVQKGMLAQTLHSEGLEYVNSVWFQLPNEVSTVLLQNAWRTACENNEMLRTIFVSMEDPKHPFVMVVQTKAEYQMPWYESGNSPNTSNAEDTFKEPWSLSLCKENGANLLRFTAHHALYDAQSIQMLLSEIANTFANQSSTPRPPVAPLLGAILQESQQNLDEKKIFWEKEENKIIVNRFPDLTPLRVSDTTSAVKEITSQSTSSRLEELCRSSGVTVQAATQATWARLLSFYIGETSTTFGMTLSGRSIRENGNHIAFPSIVTLPVRCVISGTNAELLSRTMNSNALLHKHQFTPLTSIQKWGGYPEGKIFDTLFAYQKLPAVDDEVNMPWEIMKEEASVDYAVSLEVQPTSNDEVTLRLTFRIDLVPTEHAGLLLQQYDTLLLDILENPQNPCDVAPGTSKSLLSITAAEESSLPGPVTLLHQFVELGARNFPDRKALEFATNLDPNAFKSTSWTYSQLDLEANKIANKLLNRGVKPGQMIAICFDKCAEASFTIIGILKAGCAYVALDPNAPGDRLKFIVEDSGANLVVTAGKPGQNLKDLLDVEIIKLDSRDVLANYSSEQPKLSRAITPEDVSYCLYTSGTTGTPKGCLITHENTVQFMLAFSCLFAGHWDETSKYLQFASFHFDVSVMEQFWSWSVGICVASAPRDLIFEDITGAIQQLRITHIDLTPSLARLIHPNDVPTLCKGAFITGGEQLKQEILDVWGEYACIYNGYGPTEATIGCTMYPRVPKNGKPSNIGPAYINVGTYVLKPGTELPVLRGAIGELCVSGKLVGKGYLNRPDLTEERFPTLKSFNERAYRTGDLVRILHDGSFIFLGRADDQVKLRGQRLELSEINEVIKRGVDGIDEVVTLVLKHSTQQKEQLVTFFVAKSHSDNESASISVMRDACKSRLPGYMVPTHFIPIKALPLNANNKADSKQLAAIYNELKVEDLQRLSQAGQDLTTWTESEKQVLNIIGKALQIDATALTSGTTIFELGVDSISIIGFARSLQNAGLDNAKLSVVKNNPSMKSLVRALLEVGKAGTGRENAYVEAAQSMVAFEQRHMVSVCEELEVESVEVEKIVPCTPVQEGMIYRFLESETALYFNEFVFKLDEGVEVERLRSAWKRVVERLEVLRLKFVATNDGFAQVVLRKGDNSAYVRSVGYNSEEKAAALRSPYSLNLEGRTMRLQIFHGLYDGNSLTMLLHRVVDEYHEQESIKYGPSFTSSLPYGPLAKVPGAKEFWISHLSDWASSQLRDDLESTNDIVATSTLDNLTGFDYLRKRLGVTPQAIVQAAWISVLQTIASPNLTIGIVTSGRAIDFEGADKVIGPLFNTVPFHISIQPGTKSFELITECHDFNMQMQDFQHTPLKDIQRWSAAKPGQSLVDTLFVFQRPEEEDQDFAKGVWRKVRDEMVADYPLAFEATLSPDSSRLSLTIVAQGSAITQSVADDLLLQFEKAMVDMLGSLGEKIISSLDPSDYNGTEFRNQSVITNKPSKDDAQNGPFIWTEEAKTIRSEIATLANVSEDTIKETSSIFELGLDSIDVIKLASRLKRQGIEIPVSIIVKSQTIANIALKTSSKNSSPRAETGQLLPQMSRDLTRFLNSKDKLPRNAEAILPATPLQQSMVNEMINSGYKRYFNVDGFELSEGVDLERLREAIRSVVEQSPILRTTFVEVDDPKAAVSFAQIVHSPEQQYKCILSETTVLGDEQSFTDFMSSYEAHSAKLAAEDQQLFQARFIAAGTSKYLVITISHALYDGTSLRSIHEDIQRAYNGQVSSRPDFMPFLEEVFQSTTEDAKKFWRTTLSNLPPATFPQKGSHVEEPHSSTRLEQRSRVALKDIEALCKTARITLQTLGQACWALVLSHLMGQLDIVFGSVLSCRDSEEASSVMFPLMNTVAVRSVIHGSLADLLRYMQDMSDTTRQYQHFPLGTAQAYALANRKASVSSKNTTLFDTLFIYQGRRQTVEEGKLYESVYGISDVEFPVCVEMEIVDDEYLSWTTACKAIARDAEETKGILDALDQVLERIVSAPDTPAIVTSQDGISVCGLPSFKPKEEQKKTIIPRAIDDIDAIWTSTELAIRRALQTLSNIPEDAIRKDSTIFHLGLDSISVLKLPALLKTSGIKLSVSDIMREQTVAAMAKAAQTSVSEAETYLDEDQVIADATSDLDLDAELASLEEEAGEIDYIMPATAGEQYMIRQWQVSQGAMFYQTFTYTLQGPIENGKLEEAWKTLLARHDILRTGFVEVQSRLLQIVFKNPLNRVIYQSQGTSAMTRRSSGDLRLPPLNLVVEITGDSEVAVQLVLHHALYDGVSLPILINELQALYRGIRLEPPSLEFKNFVAQSLSAVPLSATQEKWTAYLGSNSTPKTPLSALTGTKRTEVFHPSTPIKSLRKLAQDTGVSTDALFLAAISKLRARTLQQQNVQSQNSVSQVVFGIYLANRAPFGSDLSSLAAPTLNLLPVCVHTPLERGVEEIAKNVQSDISRIGSKEMVSASLEQIFEWTGVRVDCFVNILRPENTSRSQGGTIENKGAWRPVQDLGSRAEIVENELNEAMMKRDARDGAYLPSVDIELRYHGEEIDMGVFAPEEMLSVAGAEKLIEDFIAFWK